MSSFLTVVISNLCVATLIAVLATLVGLWRRQHGVAHLLWFAVLVKMITPPVIGTPVPMPEAIFEPVASLLATEAEEESPSPAGAIVSATPTIHGQLRGEVIAVREVPAPIVSNKTSRSLGWAVIAIWIWLICAFMLLFRGAWRFIAFARLIQRAASIDESGTALAKQIAGGHGPPVCLMPARISPMLFGIGRWTRIVCPEQLWESFSLGQRRAFVAHEIAHYRRRDHWVRWVEWLISALYWWFPITLWARRQLERFEELACDSWVVTQAGVKRKTYGETLLQVVDFLEKGAVAAPRMASRLQPESLLEERLHELREHRPTGKAAPTATISVCCLALLIHPYGLPIAYMSGAPLRSPIAGLPTSSETNSVTPLIAKDVSLPDAPKGWWNESPSKRWASISLSSDGDRLLADAGQGITLKLAGKPEIHFPFRGLTSFVLLPVENRVFGTKQTEHRRVLFGDASGALRVWDLADGDAVSLVGQHSGPITSTTYHESIGFAAADANGSVIRWDVASGEALGTWTSGGGRIQSIRWSKDGKRLGVYVGSWDSLNQPQFLELDGASLEPIRFAQVPSETALVHEYRNGQWQSVAWDGFTHDVFATEHFDRVSAVGRQRVSKDDISSMVFSQDFAESVRFQDVVDPLPARFRPPPGPEIDVSEFLRQITLPER